ncbi:Holliday junction resolvase RuvX [Sutterella sp.]|uniref:Holliday junction resolvase RuvX n=1 Tax=Sutterella sp. TaxID=1981025 RepID=UPI0026DF2644|nr:Holliday junction resolvase RuvX [Sutterella sp.]MDO5530668.1 Holliday junction resolvase RuvX [Sutterella sp.]
MKQEPEGVVLAFDFGLARTGAAVGNTLTNSARALAILDTPTNDSRWKAVAALIEEWSPAFLVVGVPRLGDGSPSTLTARCERFARQLGGRHHLKVFTVDERFSSVEVEHGRDHIDDEAARVILEQFFRESEARRAAASH